MASVISSGTMLLEIERFTKTCEGFRSIKFSKFDEYCRDTFRMI